MSFCRAIERTAEPRGCLQCYTGGTTGAGQIDDLLRWNSGPGRLGDVRRYPDQCRGRQHFDLPQTARIRDPKKRVMAIASAGNLSIGQSVVSTLTEGYDNPETGEHETLMNAPTLFQAARRVGHVVRAIHATEGKTLEVSDVTFDVSFLYGGQILGERMRLFMIYSAGNFIECTVDTPYLQIGEHKYGKPVLDRAINYEMD